MEKVTHLDHLDNSLMLPCGPLCYQLVAHDDWGREILTALTQHVACGVVVRPCDRIIHLRQWGEAGRAEGCFEELPKELNSLLPVEQPLTEWHRVSNQMNTLWRNAHSRHVFWTAVAAPRVGNVRFHLPWGLIVDDLVARGGGLVHAGLASLNGAGLLLLAPPSGGKSTTLGSAPAHWDVLSDDAALLWPDENGGWLASPLPAWGNLIQPAEEWRYPQIALEKTCHLKSLLLLEKGADVHLEQLPAVELVPSLHRALCEYPAAIMAETARQEELFRTSARMARELLCWRLTLPLHGDVWPLLETEAV